MPDEWYKSVAKKSHKKSGKKTTAKKVKKYKKKAMKEVPKDVEDKHAYATAVALRRAQKTGGKKHKKLSERSNNVCPKCGSNDVLTGTGEIKNHCGECGEYWGHGGKPKNKDGKKHTHKEEATGTGAIGNVFGGGMALKRKKRKKKKVEEYFEMLADMIDEDVDDYNPNEIADAMIEADDIIEAYNDNYLRPNQQARRTKNRMSDGTQPAGALETKRKRKPKKL